MFHRVSNLTESDDLDALPIPTRPNGSFYRFEMICDNGWTRIYDDTPEGLLSALIEGYGELTDPTDRLTARVRHAVDTQVALQTTVNQLFDADKAATEAEKAVLFSARTTAPQVDIWDCTVPLVVVDAFYAPFSPLPAPVSVSIDLGEPANLWWLTPAAGDWEYLCSLHQCSAIDLHTARGEI